MVSEGTIKTIPANWPAPPGIHAFTTTRVGGFSVAPYHELNLGDHVGDQPDLVTENRELFYHQCELPSAPVWLQQVHGTASVRLRKGVSSELIPPADAAWTTAAGIVCAVLTADCLPLLICNRTGNKVMAIHAGWRGMADGVIEKGIAGLDERPQDLMAWAGPCIGPNAFELGTDVATLLGGSQAAYTDAGESGKVLADLRLLARERLAAIGVMDFHQSNACTFTQDEAFFSYRRDGLCGRMASVIWIGK